MMLQKKLEQFGVRLSAITENCFHYYRSNKKMPCIVWSEDGEDGSFYSDNLKSEQNLTGTISAYSKTEFDSLFDEVQTVLDEMGAAWFIEAVQFEEETNLIHYTWRWRCSFNGETEVQGY